jgi:exonuclease VII small subunit
VAEFDPAADLREFIREMMVRFERTMAGFERRMVNFERAMVSFERAVASFEARQVSFERRTDAVIDALQDLREESRAQREALWRVLDRLDNGGAAPAG